MYFNFIKFIPIVFFLIVFLVPQNIIAQSHEEQIISRYEKGQLKDPAEAERQIIEKYLNSNQKQGPYYGEPHFSPDATYYINEDFADAMATPLVIENFNYPIGDSLTGHGWTKHSGTNPTYTIKTTAGNLTYTNYPASGIGNMVTFSGGASSREDINFGIVDSQYVDNATVYYSFLVKINTATATADYFIHLGNRASPTSFTNFAARVYVQDVAGSLRFGVGNSTATMGTTNFSDSTTYLVVVKYTISTAGNDECKLWILSSGIPLTEALAGTPEVTTSTSGQNIIDAIALRQGSQAYTVTVDGINVGKNWNEILLPTIVVPPAGWSQNIISGSASFDYWYFNNPGTRTLSSPITSPAAIFDSDFLSENGGAEDVALVSLPFNPPAATTVILEWNQYFQGGFGGAANVEVWNGSSWISVYSTTVSTPNPDFKSINISSHVAGVANAKVRFRWTGDYSWYWTVDNVVVLEPDPIPTPAILVSPANGSTNVNPYTSLNWIAGGGASPTGYRINFGTNNPPTNIENNTNLGLVTTYVPNPILSPNTTYYWEIIPYSGVGNATGTVIWSFTTGADPTISTLPYTQNFDVVTAPELPYGWSIENTNGDSYAWTTYTSGTPHSAPNHMSVRYSTADAMNDWFFSPPIQVTSGVSYNLRFWYKASGYDESMEVKWGASPTSAGMTQGPIFNDPLFSFTAYTDTIVTFTPPTSGIIYIGWHGYSIADQNRIYVDDVTFEVTPVVPTFSITPTLKDFGFLNSGDTSYPQNFIITNSGVGTLTINSGGVTLTGTDAGQFLLYPVTYPINLGAGESDTVIVSFAPTTIGSKSANLQVVHNGAGGISIVPISGIAFPSNTLIESFSDTTFPPTNWLAVNNDGGAENWLRTEDYYNSGPAAAGSYYEGSTFQNDDWLITPKLTIANGDSLSFWHRARSVDYTEVLYIKVGTTNDPNGVWTDIAILNDNTTNWKYESYDLSSYLGDKYIAFVNKGFDQWAIFIDDILGPAKSEANTFQLSVDIATGWNMVSIPGLHPVDQNVGTWWAFKDPAANVFRYSGGYQAVTAATPGTGYWMKHSGARTYNTGEEWPAGGINIVPHTPLNGAAGWNLIGGYEIVATAALVTTNPPGQQSGPIFKYSGGYSVATQLVPGYGYWIKLSSAAQIIIPETLAKDAQPVEWFPENWGKIVLTDAAGINYTLYAVKGETDLSQYELPPAPMAGMFDIRYSSGRIAEDLNSAIKTIEMSGVTYPLTVRVEGMDIRLMDETGKNINVNLKSGEDVVISDATIQKLMVSGELIPAEYALEQNYPNPFNPSTVIEFSLPENVGNVKLSIYNALGEKVAELVNTALTAGKYQYQWNAQNVATGMYIYELRTDKFVSVKKMLLLK